MNTPNNYSQYSTSNERPRRIEPPGYHPPLDYFDSLTDCVMAKVKAESPAVHPHATKHKSVPFTARNSKTWLWMTRMSIATVVAACMGFAFLIDHVISFQPVPENHATNSTSALAENESNYADEVYDYLMLNDYILCDYAEDTP